MKKQMKQMGVFGLILGALALAAQALFGGGSGYVAANTYDAAVETHLESVRRTNDAAVTTRHLLWKEGATPGKTIALNGADDKPLGTVDNVVAGTGMGQTVLLLSRGPTRKMVAAAEIAIGADVYTAAGGKVGPTPASAGTYYKVGRALTGAGADTHVIEVETHEPVLVKVLANNADLTAVKAAVTDAALIKFLGA